MKHESAWNYPDMYKENTYIENKYSEFKKFNTMMQFYKIGFPDAYTKQ